MQNTNSVLLIDDHPIFRKGVRDVITNKTSYHVVAEADDGRTGITMVRFHKPSVTIVDLALQDMSGFDVIEKARKLRCDSHFVVLTLYNDASLIQEAINLGAAAYLMKSDGVDVLESCLQNLEGDSIFLSPGVGAPLPQKPDVSAPVVDWKTALTEREKTVLRGIASHRTSSEIALELTLSTRTVQNHRARIIRKLGLTGNNSLYRFALENAAQLSQKD